MSVRFTRPIDPKTCHFVFLKVTDPPTGVPASVRLSLHGYQRRTWLDAPKGEVLALRDGDDRIYLVEKPCDGSEGLREVPGIYLLTLDTYAALERWLLVQETRA